MKMHNHKGLVEKSQRILLEDWTPTVYCVYPGISSSCDVEFSDLKVIVIKICEKCLIIWKYLVAAAIIRELWSH